MALVVGGMKRFILWMTGLLCALLFGQSNEAVGMRIQGEGKTRPTVQQKPQVVKPQLPPPKVIVKPNPPPISPRKPESPQIMVKYGVSPSGSPGRPGPRR